MSRAGFDVALIGDDEDDVRSMCLSVLGSGGRALGLAIDGTQHSPFVAALGEIRERLGPIDVWISLDACGRDHRPMRGPASPPRQVSVAEPFAWGLGDAFDDMLRHDGGTLVVVESSSAFVVDGRRRNDCAMAFARRGYVEGIRQLALSRDSAVRVSSLYTTFPEPNSSDVERVTAHGRQIGRAVVTAARNGRRQSVVGLRTWLSITTARLFPGTYDHHAAHIVVGDEASTTLDWSGAAGACRSRWREIVMAAGGTNGVQP